ncbi:di/tricarboxylate transporter [Sinobacterium caligoides]|uniref:Di/tricarboxylate transporter n=1 Tax=Sinobacterium caligoides TaxID=933926 RepID=A0A3N2DZ80_9GAMM|nr:SLC13 family permease [Sinobacterium caligoides]ROS05124.1 di/tricarboxylate transporter [Sinobacterium caligoides]
MAFDAWLTLLIVAVTFILLALSSITADGILVSAVACLVAFGVIDIPTALQGLSNEGVATVGVLYIVARGLSQSGAVAWMSQGVLGRPRSTMTAQLRLMLPVAAVSSVLNNTPVVAMMVPAVSDWARRNKLSVSQLMMPLSFAAITGGLCTLVGTSTNLVLNDMFNRYQADVRLSLFEIAWVGVPCVLVMAAYVVIFSRRLLPNKSGFTAKLEGGREYVVEMVVEPFSPLAGLSIEKAGLRHLPGLFLVEIVRNNRVMPAVASSEVLYAGDRLVFAGDVEAVVDLKRIHGLRSGEEQVFKLDDVQDGRCLIEVVISANNPLVGESVRDGRFRTRYTAAIIAITREGEKVKGRLGDVELRAGDNLLLEAADDFVEQYAYAKDFLLVSRVANSEPLRHGKRWWAISILLAMVVAVSGFGVSMLGAAVLASFAMVMTGCLSTFEARSSIDFQVLMVIAASIALGAGVQQSGLATHVASSLFSVVSGSAYLSLAAIFLLTAGFSALISNVAAAVLLFPVAVALSETLGVSVTPFVITLMVAASTCFATPIGYQTNLMVYGPGGYKFVDFLRMGGPLTFLVGVLTVLIAPLVWPF